MCEAAAGQSARRRIDLADAGSVGGMCGADSIRAEWIARPLRASGRPLLR